MSYKTPSKTTDKPTAVTFFNQAVRSFVTPYGAASEAPEPAKIYGRLKPFTCEWLSRPKVALSEYAETVISNLKILEKTGNDVASPKIVKQLKQHFAKIMPNLDALNNKTDNHPTVSDVKHIIRSIVQDDDEMDDAIDQLFHISNALFTISSNYIIARSLLRHPKQYAQLVETSDITSGTFKKKGTVEAMKSYLYKDYIGSKTQVKRQASKTVQKAMESSSGEQSTIISSSSTEEDKTKSRKRRRKEVHSSSHTDDTDDTDEPPNKTKKKTKQTTKRGKSKKEMAKKEMAKKTSSSDSITTTVQKQEKEQQKDEKVRKSSTKLLQKKKEKPSKNEGTHDIPEQIKTKAQKQEQPSDETPTTSALPDKDERTTKIKKNKKGK